MTQIEHPILACFMTCRFPESLRSRLFRYSFPSANLLVSLASYMSRQGTITRPSQRKPKIGETPPACLPTIMHANRVHRTTHRVISVATSRFLDHCAMSARSLTRNLIRLTALAVLLQPLVVLDCGCGPAQAKAAGDIAGSCHAKSTKPGCCRRAMASRSCRCHCHNSESGTCNCAGHCVCSHRDPRPAPPAVPSSENERSQSPTTMIAATLAPAEAATPQAAHLVAVEGDLAASLSSTQMCVRLCRFILWIALSRERCAPIFYRKPLFVSPFALSIAVRSVRLGMTRSRRIDHRRKRGMGDAFRRRAVDWAAKAPGLSSVAKRATPPRNVMAPAHPRWESSCRSQMQSDGNRLPVGLWPCL